ncbi:hypothetical protein [Rhodococcus sp. A5(2022)]|uniref:hypothetical protein n=1 Tax=Rhodococcus sp. A5(2022) TaxID=3003588 RepID=UPI0022A8B2F7|nr:hypothetical protein [Rhodococcus sp. A5(2022)]MCZ1075063.1 hypothetical protein [Rhodococcus sp. A5(2022)]
MASRCRDCKEEITWATSTGSGKRIRLDLYPDPAAGRVRKRDVRDEDGVVYADILRGDDLHRAIADQQPLYVLHSDTCHARRPPNPKPPHIRIDLPRRAKRQWRYR